jgi:hypothetical protein
VNVQTKHTIICDGRTDWTVIVGTGASLSEIRAAQELQHFLHEMTGVMVPIVDDQGPLLPNEILIGKNDHLSHLELSIDFDELGAEGFWMGTTNDHLVIAGGRERGTLYGVYTFLEDYLGCRWFSPKVSRIPKRDRVELSEIRDKQIPIAEYRETLFYTAFDGDWSSRNKLNGHFPSLEGRHGGKVKYSDPFVHSFDHFVPVDRYFETHPEYFSQIDGTRISDRTQLCLTNEDVLKLVIEGVKKTAKENPDVKIISISQNDWYNPCHCENCRAIDEAEGSHSGTMIRFVNQVAEEIESEFPDIAIDTLAYQYTRKAPRTVRPRLNVIVRLCSIECCFSHPLKHCREQPSFKHKPKYGDSFAGDLQEWAKISNRLYVWDYVTNFSNYVMPFPNLRVLQPNIQFFTHNSVKGIFEQGSYAIGGGGEFAELRAYLIAKLLWNPEYNVDLAMNEFLNGYFGLAAAPIRCYIDLLHDKVVGEHIHTGIYDPPTNPYLPAELVEKAAQWLDRAEVLADNEEILQRVKAARLPIRYVQLWTMAPDSPGRQKAIDEFFNDLEKNGITEIWESRPLEKSKQQMKEGKVYTIG